MWSRARPSSPRPLGGMTLAQLGADVIRFDPIGGGLDRNRWPVTEDGTSLFWTGLNKGKRSIQVDLRSPAGQELVDRADHRARRGGGLFLTNFPARGWLDYEALRGRPRRPDHGQHQRQPRRHLGGRLHRQPGHRLSVGHRPAQPVGVPSTTCCRRGMRSPARSPPAGMLAAERHRTRTGEGQLVRVALSDVAFAMVGNLGKIAEAQICRRERPKDGNYLYGAFGRDFLTDDGQAHHDRRADPAPVAEPGRGDRSAARPSRRSSGCSTSTSTRRAIASRRARCSARSLKPWTISRTLEEIREVFDAPRGLLGPLPDVHGAGRRGSALLDRQPDVRRGRAAGDRHLPDGRARRSTSPSKDACPPPGRRCSASTRTRCWPSCSGSAKPRSDASTTRESLPAPARWRPESTRAERRRQSL